MSKLEPCSTTLLAARLVSYGTEVILIGASDAIPPTPTEAEWGKVIPAVAAGIERAPAALSIRQPLLLVCGEYLAAQRVLRERRRRAEDAEEVTRARVALKRAGGLTEEQSELLRLQESGLLNAPVYFRVDDGTVAAMAPYTESGREHEDVTGITALRLGAALKSAGVRAQVHGLTSDIWETGATILSELTGEDVSRERMRKRAGAFRSKLRQERARRARLFSLSAEQVLRAPLRTPEHLLDPRREHEQGTPPVTPAYVLLGLSDWRGNLIAPRDSPSPVSAWSHIPAHFIPALEAWHDQLHWKR